VSAESFESQQTERKYLAAAIKGLRQNVPASETRHRWTYGDGVFGIEWVLGRLNTTRLNRSVKSYFAAPNSNVGHWHNRIPDHDGVISYDVPNHVLFHRDRFLKTELFSPEVAIRLKRETQTKWKQRDVYSNVASPFLPFALQKNTPQAAFESSHGVAPPLNQVETPEELLATNKDLFARVRASEAAKVFEGSTKEQAIARQHSLSWALSHARHEALSNAMPWLSRRGVADCNNPNLPSAAFQATKKWGRDYLARNSGSMYREFPKTTSNLSLFNDYMAKLLVDLEYVYKCNTVHSKTILALLAHLNSTDPAREIKAHLFMLGPAGSSKSFSLLLVAKLAIEGTVSVRTYMTAKSDTASGSQDGTTVIIEEMQGDLASKDGANTTQQAIFKARLCSGYTTVAEPYYNAEGQRSQRTLYCRSNCTFVVASNMKRRDVSGPIEDRFIMMPSMEEFRSDRELTQLICSVDPPELSALRKMVTENFRWMQYHISMINSLIQCGVLPAVSLPFTMVVLPEIHKYAKKLGVTNTQRPRPTARLKAIMRTLVLIRAVLYVFGSPISPLAPTSTHTARLATHPPPTLVEWSNWKPPPSAGTEHRPEHYLEVLPYLNDSDPSLLVFAVGILKHQWEPPMLSDIVQVLSKDSPSTSWEEKEDSGDDEGEGDGEGDGEGEGGGESESDGEVDHNEERENSPRRAMSAMLPYGSVGNLVQASNGGGMMSGNAHATFHFRGNQANQEPNYMLNECIQKLSECCIRSPDKNPNGDDVGDQDPEQWFVEFKTHQMDYFAAWGETSRVSTLKFAERIKQPVRQLFPNLTKEGMVCGVGINFSNNDTFYKKITKVARRIQALMSPRRPDMGQLVSLLLQLTENIYTTVSEANTPMQVRGIQIFDSKVLLAPQLVHTSVEGRMRRAVLLALSHSATRPAQYMFGPDQNVRDRPYQYELVTSFKREDKVFKIHNLNHLSIVMAKLMGDARNNSVGSLVNTLRNEQNEVCFTTPIEDVVLRKFLSMHGLYLFAKNQQWVPERRLIAELVMFERIHKSVEIVVYPQCYDDTEDANDAMYDAPSNNEAGSGERSMETQMLCDVFDFNEL